MLALSYTPGISVGPGTAAPAFNHRASSRNVAPPTASMGAVCGIAAAAFIHGLHLLEGTFDKIGERYTRHAIGMLLVGVLMFALQ